MVVFQSSFQFGGLRRCQSGFEVFCVQTFPGPTDKFEAFSRWQGFRGIGDRLITRNARANRRRCTRETRSILGRTERPNSDPRPKPRRSADAFRDSPRTGANRRAARSICRASRGTGSRFMVSLCSVQRPGRSGPFAGPTHGVALLPAKSVDFGGSRESEPAVDCRNGSMKRTAFSRSVRGIRR